MAKLRITYRKSAIGFSKDQKVTVRSLGLRKLNSVVIQEDTPAIRGMIFKVKHLVTVEEVNGDVQPEVKMPHKTTVVRPRETASTSSAPTDSTTSVTVETVDTDLSSSTSDTGNA